MRLKAAAIALLVMATTVSPAQAAPNYVFPIVGCDYTYAKAHHDYPATDILAKAGCRYVAVTSGVIDEVYRVDSWSGKTNLGVDRGGLYVSFIGTDGVRYYASHLRTIPKSIQPGVEVKAGRLIGIVGANGSARGTKSVLFFFRSYPTVKPGAVISLNEHEEKLKTGEDKKVNWDNVFSKILAVGTTMAVLITATK